MKATQIMCALALLVPLAACDKGAAKAEAGEQAKAEPAKAETDAKAKADAKQDGAKAEGDAAKDAADKPVAINVDAEGRGLRGFDAVAYRSGAPVAGVAEHEASWGGAKWQFSSAENKAKFEAEPEKFAPQNGGFCTFGVVVGKKFDGDPQVWHLEDEKLYVFLNQEVKDKFLQDQSGNLAKVATNWPNIKDKRPEELGE